MTKTVSDTTNCLRCGLYAGCADPAKSFSHICAKFTARGSFVDFKAILNAKREQTRETKTGNGSGSKSRRGRGSRRGQGLDKSEDESKEEVNTASEKLHFSDQPKQNPKDIDLSSPRNLDLYIKQAERAAKRGMVKNPIVDDASFEEAANFYEFVTDERFLKGHTLFPKQFETGINYFDEYCQNPDCTDLDYAVNVPTKATFEEILSKITLLRHGCCPKCNRNRRYWWRRGKSRRYWELCGLAGQRSGKSALVSYMIAYLIHRYIKAGSPQKILPGVSPNTILHGVFIATTFAQARDTIFNPLTELIAESPWFKAYHEFLDMEGKKQGRPLYKFKDTIIEYVPQGLYFYPSVPNKRSLRGRALVCLTGDSLVSTNKGLHRIDHNIRGARACAFGEHSFRDIVNWVPAGKRRVMRLTTKYGYNLTATPNHEVKIMDSHGRLVWKRMDELAPGDLISINYGNHEWPTKLLLNRYEPPGRCLTLFRKTLIRAFERTVFYLSEICQDRSIHKVSSRLRRDGIIMRLDRVGQGFARFALNPSIKDHEFAKILDLYTSDTRKHTRKIRFPTEMTPALASLLGYMVSEGSFAYKTWEFNFPNTDKRVIDHFASCFREVFGVQPRVHGPFPRYDENHKEYWRVSMGLREFKHFFRWIGLKPSIAVSKLIPSSILQADKDSVRAFLSAMFEGDGCIYGDTVSYASTSLRLIQQTQILLLKFGIISNIRTIIRRSERHNDMYDLRLFTWDSHKFLNDIGFVTKTCRSMRARNSHILHMTIPELVQLQRLPNREIKKRPVFVESGMNLSAFGVCDLVETDHEGLELLDQGLIWLPVETIVRLKRPQKVYDITVDDADHIFTANGILVSNCGSVDEIGWFSAGGGPDQKSKGAVKLDPDEIYTAMVNSYLTVRGGVSTLKDQGKFLNFPEPMLANISSPSSRFDKICRLVEDAKKSNRMWWFHYSTLQMNPFIREEDLADVKRTSPERYRRDYLAIPPRASNAFLSSPQIMVAGYQSPSQEEPPQPLLRNGVLLDQFSAESLSGAKITSCSVKFRRKSGDGIRRLMAIDAGEKKNSFAGTIGHVAAGYFVPDAMFEVVPQPDEPINFNDIYVEALCPMIEHFNVGVVWADRWQSKKLLADLEADFADDGLVTNEFSLKYDHFAQIRNALINTEIPLLKPEVSVKDAMQMAGSSDYPQVFIGKPCAHFMVQALTVEEIMGKEVVKGEGKTDDLWRSFVLAYTAAQDPDVQEALQEVIEQRRIGSIGIASSYGDIRPDPFVRRLPVSNDRQSMGIVASKGFHIGPPPRGPRGF